MLDLCTELQGNCARLVVAAGRYVGLGVTVNEIFETAVLGTSFAHVDFVVTQQDVAVDDPPAGGADAAG
jgi:hypothetical protein